MIDSHFVCKSFHELSTLELYQILALRSEVFVLEQACAYQDIDGLDNLSLHILAKDESNVFAYARILPPELQNTSGHTKKVSIGRVVVAKAERKHKWGKKLMEYALEVTKEQFPNCVIEISAQTYLSDFYHNLGFQNTGKFYLEDDIPHQTMVYKS